ncbi:ATP-binding protein [Paenibacillus hemerocallicola]|jgi:serine/threonine-protein kinase RsbW|uniref:ATP-binding protein n=1 Tax=Paenibacillus hemerocallicola TaxID=1172614 RepID=A0A5C4T2K2_9BACL|nr:ATP-binding protein [Paenibacillus hemerocallicola]
MTNVYGKTGGGGVRVTIKSVTLTNELRELERLRLFLKDSAESFQFDERTQYRLNLICDELVTNIISYGFGDRADTDIRPRIEIVLTDSTDRMVIRITDDGVPFNPLNRPEPNVSAGIEERGIGGLGIHFVKTLTDEAIYERDGERNVLRLTINRLQLPEEEQTG